MKLGSFNINFYDRDLEPALEAMKNSGCSAVELGCGGFITKRHFNPLSREYGSSPEGIC